MLTAAVPPLDSMVLLVRFFFLLPMATWIDGCFRFADVHIDLERNIADFLGTEASIIYSRGFSTISCVISAFPKRGDIIVADCGIKCCYSEWPTNLPLHCSLVRA